MALGKRVGIMGGTFNPVHLAHLILAESAYGQYALDQVVFLPSGRPAYKDAAEILPESLRYQMLGLAIQDNPHFSLSDLELRRGGNTYTADTILELKRLEPDTEFYFILGGDSLLSFEKWSRPEVILANAHLLAAGRGGMEQARLREKAGELGHKYHPVKGIHLFEAPAMDLSSTSIRRKIRAGDSIRYLVPGQVEDFIMEQGCYKAYPGF